MTGDTHENGQRIDFPQVRVLVVDDYAPFRNAVARLLGGHGYAIEGVANLGGARNTLREGDTSPQPFDIVVLDLMLDDDVVADCSGENLVPFIKALRRPPKVLVMTASQDPKRNLLIGQHVDAAVYKVGMLDKELIAAIDRIRRAPSDEAVQFLASKHGLSLRETLVLLHASRGLDDHESAFRMGVSVSTVRNTWTRIRAKLGVTLRSDALRLLDDALSNL